jgi:copper homeostasis protein CutC
LSYFERKSKITSTFLGALSYFTSPNAYEDTNITQIKATAGLIGVTIHPASNYDRDKNYWIKVAVNADFDRIKQLDAEYPFQLSRSLGVDA